MFFHKPKQTKAERVKILLLGAGKRGVSNWDLNRVTFRYGAVIFALRHEGYKITTVKIGNDGLYRYTVTGKAR